MIVFAHSNFFVCCCCRCCCCCCWHPIPFGVSPLIPSCFILFESSFRPLLTFWTNKSIISFWKGELIFAFCPLSLSLYLSLSLKPNCYLTQVSSCLYLCLITFLPYSHVSSFSLFIVKHKYILTSYFRFKNLCTVVYVFFRLFSF